MRSSTPIFIPTPIIIPNGETEVADRIIKVPNNQDAIGRIAKVLQTDGYSSAYYDSQTQTFRHKYMVSLGNQLENIVAIMAFGSLVYVTIPLLFMSWNLFWMLITVFALISGYQLVSVGTEGTEDIDLISEVKIKDSSIYLSISSDYSMGDQIDLLDSLTKEFGISKQDVASWVCEYCKQVNSVADYKCQTCGAPRRNGNRRVS